MPPQKLLTEYRGKVGDSYVPREANGAFWLNNSEKAPHLVEIEEEVARLRYSAFLIKDDQELETEVSHLGNMIARYSDAKVEDFDRRLKHAQNLGLKYREVFSDRSIPKSESEKLRIQAINANLDLSYESRFYLQETLKRINHFGNPLTVEIKDDERIEEEHIVNFKNALRHSSIAYPSSWNNALNDKIKLSYIYDTERESSSFNRNNNEIRIHPGSFKFASYRSLSEAEDARNENEFEYATNVEMVHELAHKFEFIQTDIVRVSRSFLRRRGFGGRDVNFDSDAVIPDHFTWSYVGQLWGHRHTEVFSVGMESTILGTQGSSIGLALPAWEDDDAIKIYRPDIEHRNLTLGILASINIPFNNDTGYEDIQNIKRKKAQTMFGEVEPFYFK